MENVDGGVKRAVQEEFASPVEEIALAGIGVGGGLEFVGCGDKIPVPFLDFAEKVVEFGGVFGFEKVMDELSGLGKVVGE